jgi:hypothetical protein
VIIKLGGKNMIYEIRKQKGRNRRGERKGGRTEKVRRGEERGGKGRKRKEREGKKVKGRIERSTFGLHVLILSPISRLFTDIIS